MREADLADALAAWFGKSVKNRWTTPVGRLLKGSLIATGNWKNAPRGDPKAGYVAMREKTGYSNGLTQNSSEGGYGD